VCGTEIQPAPYRGWDLRNSIIQHYLVVHPHRQVGDADRPHDWVMDGKGVATE
jgi:hypothetical protein